ncbi:MAG: acyltransferase, partial [Treponema sp.]|nr:acyltransferase [Treponema sp.]
MIKPLTSLRFFFALLVFLSHYTVGENIIFPHGAIGVEFFFILSGFIISYTYKQKITEKQITTRNFLIARFARVYPLHGLMLVLSVLLALRAAIRTDIPFPIGQLFFQIPLLQSFIPIKSYYFSFNAVSWSISDELFFYVMFPLLISFFHTTKKRRLLIYGFGVLLLYFTAVFFIPEAYHHAIFYINPFCRIIDFIIGMSLFNVSSFIRSHKDRFIWLRNGNQWFATLVELGVIGLMVFTVVLSKRIPQVYRYASYYWIPMSLIILVFAKPANGGGGGGGGGTGFLGVCLWLG